MADVAVFVPAGDDLLGIDPGSGIVGRPVSGGSRIEVYYEGNFNYANVKTFADRVMIAYDRMAQEYPTIARSYVKPELVRQVGVYDTALRRVEPFDGECVALADWMGVPVEQFSLELRRSDG